MARERYLRLRLAISGVEYIAGLELKPDDDYRSLRSALKVRMLNASKGILPGRYVAVAEAIEISLDEHWPDRKFFIEIGNDCDSWIQVWDNRRVFE